MEETLTKRDSTKRLVGALDSLSILNTTRAVETASYTEVQFRVPEGSKDMWQTLMRRLLFSNLNKVFVNKKYQLREGDMGFSWSFCVISDDIDKDTNEAVEYILTNISQTKDKPADIELVQKATIRNLPGRQKKALVRPIVVKDDGKGGKIMEWEIPLANTTARRNQPRPGSAKGAQGIDERGSAQASLLKNFYAGKTGRGGGIG